MNCPVCWRGRGGALLCLAPEVTGECQAGLCTAQGVPDPVTPTGHERFRCEPRAWSQAELLASTLEEAKGWECTPGDTGLQPPCLQQGLRGLSTLHQHPPRLWDVLPAQPQQNPHRGTQLASLLASKRCVGDASAASAPALGEERCAFIPAAAKCKEPVGPLKPPWGFTLPSLVQLMVAASSTQLCPSSCGCAQTEDCPRGSGR